jgi:anti-sigma B factor antagonist
MDIQFEEISGALVVTPRIKRLDAVVAVEFRAAVIPRVEKSRLVVLSCTELTFMDSSGLAALISVLKRLPPGAQLRLAAPNASVRSMLALTRMDKVFSIHDSVEDALRG